MSIQPHFYIESLSPLYEDVQAGEVFPDSKFFVDCIPLSPPGDILAAYAREKQQPGFVLETFVRKHFQLPPGAADGYRSGDKPLVQHLTDLWEVLQRKPDQTGGTLIPLPHPYIVPGGRFREIYYWDSYFTMLGLQASKRVDIIQDMVDNFAYLIDQVGFIPNGNRTYYLGRSQPPFFSLMLTLLMEEKGRDILFQYRPQLEKEYHFWMEGSDQLTATNPTHRRVVLMPDGSILNRYWDDMDTPRPEAFLEDTHVAGLSAKEPAVVFRHIRAAAESGWDFSSRWFRDGKNMETIQTTDLIPVDLNCLLLFLEISLCTIYEQQDKEALENMLQKLMHRNKAIDQYCWSGEKGFYFDYQFKDRKQSSAWTLAAAFPLFFNIATPDQSAKVAAQLEEKFLQPGGLTTTLMTSCQLCDAPNGWAPLQWISYKA
ncbi:MAG: trehalase, partial [Sediminibacterium sp.]|nr:trehalase [Sediminibacterium sp.]